MSNGEDRQERERERETEFFIVFQFELGLATYEILEEILNGLIHMEEAVRNGSLQISTDGRVRDCRKMRSNGTL